MSLIEDIKNSSNWNDIHTGLIKHSNDLSAAGKTFELFAKLYFRCEPTVRDEFKHIWLFSDAPLKIKEKLGLGNKDYGIDLILEDHEGLLSVVQCKFRQDQSSAVSWSKDKLANLLADGDKADFFIIFTNASKIDTHTLSKKQNKLRVYTFGNLMDLSNETIQAMQQILLGQKPILQPKKSPKDYQKIAIDKSIEGLDRNDRGQLILPCGTGKTLISLWIQERLNPNYTLVLFPSLALLRQTKNEWAANRKQYVPYICVCSEKDIDKGDSTQVHLYEISGSVSTDPTEIRAYLRNHKQAIVFSTYQSLEAVAEAIRDTEIVFDLALCDEAHKTAGSKKGLYGLIHDNEKIQIKKRLYMTATPRILGDSAKKILNDEEVTYVADMNDPTVFGPEFHHMNFKEAIDQGILVDYKIVAMGVSDAEIEAIIKERHYVSSDDVTADEIANNYALGKFMNQYNSGHAITFHSSVTKAEGFMERHQKLFSDVDTFHVNGKQPTNERSVTLKEFERSSKSVVTNARCLTEGVDILVIDAVYFCDPKNSKVDIVQAAGRALRRADHRGKKLGYVVVPIFHRNKDGVEDAIEEGVFNNLISVIRALSSHDERLVDEIRKIKIGKGARKPQSNRLIIEDTLNFITIENMGDLSEHLFDQVIDNFRLPWRSFEEAREFVHVLGLKNKDEWSLYRNSGDKPGDIPNDPYCVFKNKGWISWGDWLGTGTIANQSRQYQSFEDARVFVHKLNLKDWNEWKIYCKSGRKPDGIPSQPHSTYKNKGWVGQGDWLGNGRIASQLKKYKSYEDARAFAHTLSFKDWKEWKTYCKGENKPDDIPTNPNQTYENRGWESVGDWLGTGVIAAKYKEFRAFSEARIFARSLKLKSDGEWREFCKSGKKPDDIPYEPNVVYKDAGWISIGDWLGSGTISNKLRNYKSIGEARSFAHALNLKGQKDWEQYCKNTDKPDDIPSKPGRVYKDKGWVSWGDWLGTGRVALKHREFRSFEEARKFVHSLKLKGQKDWQIYSKTEAKPNDIPAAPAIRYKNEWVSWGDWLGTSS